MSQKDVSKILQEADRRAREGLRVYRPNAQQREFHESNASQLIVRGGNRSGKTVCAAAEFASRALNIPIQTEDGPIPVKGPTDRPRLMWIVGYDQRHIGQTIYRELFEGGKYKVLPKRNRDGSPVLDADFFPVYETYQPWNPEHVARQDECKPVGPLIPERFIEEITWENKGDQVFNQVTLKNGTIIRAYSSTAKAKQGDAIDDLWIDEDIAFPKHVAEWEARLSDKKGRMIWSAFPHSGNDALFRLSNRASELRETENPDVFEIVLRFRDNPFMDAEEKRKRLSGWDDMERLARDEGEYLFELAQIYDWSDVRHGVFSSPTNGADQLTDLFCQTNDLPDTWTRYLALDPGSAITAVLSIAVPPPHLATERFDGVEFVVERELYLEKKTFAQVASEVFRMMGGRQYESFVIDHSAGRQTGFGNELPNHELYGRAFKIAGVESRRTRWGFEMGSRDVVQRRKVAANLFLERKIRVVLDRCPHFVKEIRNYRRRVVNHEIRDEAVGRNHHLMDCLEYLVMAERPYVVPASVAATSDPVKAFLAQLERRDKQRAGSSYLAASS